MGDGRTIVTVDEGVDVVDSHDLGVGLVSTRSEFRPTGLKPKWTHIHDVEILSCQLFFRS